MKISYLGHSSFKITTKSVVVLTDPYDKSVGYSFPKTEADIITISHNHNDHNNLSGIKNLDKSFVIDGPGEYEVKDIMIKGLSSYHDDQKGELRGKNNIFTFEIEDVHLTHMGDIGHDLSESVYSELENTDILMIPVGGYFTIDGEMAIKIIKKIDPSIILPMHYRTDDNSKTFSQIATLENFVKLIQMEPKYEEKLVIKNSILPEETELLILKRK